MIAAIVMVLPAGMSLPDWLRCLLTRISEVVAHGVCHGAMGALTASHHRLWHKMDLRRIEHGFSAAEEIPDDVDVGRLIAEFSGNAKVIAAVVDVEQVIRDDPL